MKKGIALSLFLFSALLLNSISAQTAKSSWGLGFGFTYPKYISTGLTPVEPTYGGFVSIQKNFSEHVGLRGLLNYAHLEGKTGNFTQKTNLFAGNFDLMYYLAPCEPVSPYFTIGLGSTYFDFDRSLSAGLKDESYLDYQYNLGFGAEWKIGENWAITTALNYHTVANDKLDGISDASSGLLGGSNDAYMAFNIGALYSFSKGEPSRYCELYSGINASVPEIDYDRIEGIVKKYQSRPADVVDYNRIEDIVKKNQGAARAAGKENWVLVGVNFENNSTKFTDESYPILFHTVQTLLQNPDAKVEIQGYTDNVGSDRSNQRLSEARAKAVKDYLVAKGVDGARLTTVGFGEKNPVADNKTASGRRLNRRIEFKVQ